MEKEFIFPDEQPRARIWLDGETFTFKYQGLPLATLREMCKRLALALRLCSLHVDMSGSAVVVERYPFEESPSVCLVLNDLTGEIQASLNGLADFAASVLCDNVAAYIDALLFAPSTIPELASKE